MGQTFFVRPPGRFEDQSGARAEGCFFPSSEKKKPKAKLSTCYINLQDDMVYLVHVGACKMLAEP
jgi:hypothetical protein